MGWIKEQLDADRVIAALKPHCDRSEAVVVCIRYCEADADRMRCDLYWKRGLPVGSGIVGNRFKQSGCNWSKAGANDVFAFRCCLKTCAGPNTTNGGLAAHRLHDSALPKTGKAAARMNCKPGRLKCRPVGLHQVIKLLIPGREDVLIFRKTKAVLLDHRAVGEGAFWNPGCG